MFVANSVSLVESGYGSGGGKESGGTNNPQGYGATTLPGHDVSIVQKKGVWYWRIKTRTGIKELPEESFISVYFTEHFIFTFDARHNEDVAKATKVWEVQLLKSNNISLKGDLVVFEKIIDEQYQKGWFFARSHAWWIEPGTGERKLHESEASELMPFPTESRFVIPKGLRSFEMYEDGVYPQGYSKAVSQITVTYTPPEDMDGFYGVMLLMEGYDGYDGIETVATHRYPKETLTVGSPATFVKRLEPYAPVVIQNIPTGFISTGGTWTPGTTPSASCNRRIKKMFGDSEYYGEFWSLMSTLPNYQAPVPGFYSLEVKHGDTLVCSNEWDQSKEVATDSVEAIVDLLGDSSGLEPQGKLMAFCKNTTHSFASTYTYTWWRIVRSCKFYLVPINEAGVHPPYDTGGLVQYCALDGIESAPQPPAFVNAYQYENQNSIKFYYTAGAENNVTHFTVYRRIYTIAQNEEWLKVDNVKAKDSLSYQTNITENAYEYVDANMKGIAGNTYDFDTLIQYGVSATDKAGMEGPIRLAQHYNISGLAVPAISFRRGAGIDHSVYVVTRNNTFNLFWNSKCDWDYQNTGNNNGCGNAPFFDMSPRNFTGHPIGDSGALAWDLTGAQGCFTLTFPDTAAGVTAANKWQSIILQENVSGSVLITLPPTRGGLGRTRLCIPGVGYYGIIIRYSSTVGNAGTGLKVLRLYPNTTTSNRYNPPVLGDYTNGLTVITAYAIPAADYFISTGIGDDGANVVSITRFRNGWYWPNTVPSAFTQGEIRLSRPLGAPWSSTVLQRYEASQFYSGQAVTFSAMLKENNNWSNRTGYFTCRAYLIGTEDKWAPQADITGGDILGYSADIPIDLKDIIGNIYTKQIIYITLPTYTSWANVKFVYVEFGAFYAGASDVVSDYSVIEPMLNYGSEAAPYTNMMGYNLLDKFAASPTSGTNPPNPPDEDPMCYAVGQDVMLADGTTVKTEDLKEGMILKSRGRWENVLVEDYNLGQKDTLIFCLENEATVEVSESQFCVVEPNHRYEVATAIRIGDTMYFGEALHPMRVREIRKSHNTVVHIRTTYPHLFFVNNILCHNMKKG